MSPLGVACPARNGCAVVGLDSSGESAVGWWNGSRLSFRGLGDGSFGSSPPRADHGREPNRAPHDPDLNGGVQPSVAAMTGVSCSSVRFCEAVGATQQDLLSGRVAEAITWNGRKWGPPAGPAAAGPDAQGGLLDAVSCVAADDCVAIDDGTWFERFSAGTWESDQHDPGLPQENWTAAPFDSANGVWCGSLASCVTVGVHVVGSRVPGGPMAAAGDL